MACQLLLSPQFKCFLISKYPVFGSLRDSGLRSAKIYYHSLCSSKVFNWNFLIKNFSSRAWNFVYLSLGHQDVSVTQVGSVSMTLFINSYFAVTFLPNMLNSGDLNTDHLNTGNIWIPRFLKLGFQMVGLLVMSYVIDRPFKYWTST